MAAKILSLGIETRQQAPVVDCPADRIGAIPARQENGIEALDLHTLVQHSQLLKHLHRLRPLGMLDELIATTMIKGTRPHEIARKRLQEDPCGSAR